MNWIWILFGTLTAFAGLRYLGQLRSSRSSANAPIVDDEALRRILEEGSLSTAEEEPLDLEKAARAEEEFWAESWDEPEEYSR